MRELRRLQLVAENLGDAHRLGPIADKIGGHGDAPGVNYTTLHCILSM